MAVARPEVRRGLVPWMQRHQGFCLFILFSLTVYGTIYCAKTFSKPIPQPLVFPDDPKPIVVEAESIKVEPIKVESVKFEPAKAEPVKPAVKVPKKKTVAKSFTHNILGDLALPPDIDGYSPSIAFHKILILLSEWEVETNVWQDYLELGAVRILQTIGFIVFGICFVVIGLIELILTIIIWYFVIKFLIAWFIWMFWFSFFVVPAYGIFHKLANG